MLTKQRRTFTGRNKRHLLKNLKEAITQMNLTSNEKYKVKPGKVQKLTIENNALRKVYNHYRLDKVKKNHARIVRHEKRRRKKRKKE